MSKNRNPDKQVRLQYDRENLQHAYEATCRGLSVYQAARQYHVPESTLRDRTRGKVPLGINIGFQNIFSKDEEQTLVNHIEYMASIGYEYNRTAIKGMARDYAQSLGKRLQSEKNDALSNNWFCGFLKRWPDLRLLKPQKHSLVRAKAASKLTFAMYFKELSKIISTHGLEDKPERIFITDETGITTEHSAPKIVCNKAVNQQAITSQRLSTVTIIAGGNAIGYCIPPYYVFAGKRWMNKLLNGAPPGSDGEIGWSNSEIFHTYITKHFAKHAGITDTKDQRVTLVIYNGHKSHINLTLADWAKKHNVILFVLPPHTSHLTQSWDVAIFGPFKNIYKKECHLYLRRNPGASISRYEVAGLTAKPYMKALTSENLISGFQKTGIYPVDSSFISKSQIAPSTIDSNMDCHVKSENCSGPPTSMWDLLVTTAANDMEKILCKNNQASEQPQSFIISAKWKLKRKCVPPHLTEKCNTDILESSTKKSKVETYSACSRKSNTVDKDTNLQGLQSGSNMHSLKEARKKNKKIGNHSLVHQKFKS